MEKHMKCQHCGNGFFPDKVTQDIDVDADGEWKIVYTKCPTCNRLNIFLTKHKGKRLVETLIRPKVPNREPFPIEIPHKYFTDYQEACLVLCDSPKASAALSRRCLQHLLRDKAGIKKNDLNNEIQQVIDSKSLPVHLSENLDAVRTIGNFAAHPIKSTNTGEIIEVEIGEAEWLLDILEGLFDFYFVRPEIMKKKREILNQKLKDAGKPPLKE